MSDPKPAAAGAPARGALALVFLTVLIDLLGFGMIVPLLQVYARDYHASGVTIGWLMAVFSLMQLVFSPFWGRVSDRIGRKPVLLIGLFGSFGSYLLFAFADSIPLLFASRIFAGFFGANIATAQAYVADVTTPENRAKGMGLIGAAFGIGFVFGPPIGGWLAHVSPSAPGLFAAALSLCAFLFGATRLKESHRPGDPSARRTFGLPDVKRALGSGRLAALMVGYFVITACFSSFESTYFNLGRIVLEYETWQMGLLLGAAGLFSAAVQGGMIHRLVKRHGERALLVAGPLLLGLGYFGVAYAEQVAPFLGASLVVGLAYGLCNPPLTALLSKNAAPAAQGATLGIAQSFSSLGRVVGPLAAGAAWDVDIRLPYLICGAVLIGVALGFQLYRRRFPTDVAEG